MAKKTKTKVKAKEVKKAVNKVFKKLTPSPSILRLAYILLVVFFSFVSAYHMYFAKRVIPGVYVGNVYVGGSRFGEAMDKVISKAESQNDFLSFTYDGQEHPIYTNEINLEYNWGSTLSDIFTVGRSGNFLADTKVKIFGLLFPVKLRASYSIDDIVFGTKISMIHSQIDVPAQEAEFYLENDELKIKTPMPGRRVDTGELYRLAISSIENIDFSTKKLPVVSDEPKYSLDDLEQVRTFAERRIMLPMVLEFDGEKIELDASQKLSFISVKNGGGPVSLDFNLPNFKTYLETLDQEVSNLPKGRVTQVEGDKVISFEIIQKGRKLDKKKFTGDFESAFLSYETSVKVPFLDVGESTDASKYGILALLGEGNSKYVGSGSERIHNLTLAAERTDGVLVPPGEVYSLNKAVGEISAATGYNTAWIISNGRTVLGEGGGVCQTSTTMFRAILNSGLPVVMRYPHAYRVYYYEQDMPVGFDASVYQPSVDLQFKNDTSAYILVQSSWDIAAKTLTFKLFGTPDGRTVEISDPVVTNVTPPPEAKYQDDPTLPKGTVKQIDFSAWGANVSFERTVKRGGEVLYHDVFKSNYRPWQAVYLVGTKK